MSLEEIDPKTFVFPCLFYQGKFENISEMFSYQMSSNALLGFWSPDFVGTTTLFHVVMNPKFGKKKNLEALTRLFLELLDKINTKT